jgi:hypothetical protein
MYTTELEGNVTLAFRALDGSNYEVRCSIAKYLAALLAATQEISPNSNQRKFRLFFFSKQINFRYDE